MSSKKAKRDEHRFEDADLAGAKFDDVDLSGATFHNVTLKKATFDDADASGATISNVAFTEATFDDISRAGAAGLATNTSRHRSIALRPRRSRDMPVKNGRCGWN